ncbi:unnamed protein product [Pipistrellus nathusii]|uniref:dTMP kinase n=1 Tax=Pipistrellus nathusii TaxID=59473 RepID=A0ABN9Z917_PIPNA
MAQPRCFALELPGGGLAHFAVGAAGSGGADPDPDPDPRAAALLGPPGRSYALLVPGAPGADLAARVRAARLLRRLLPALRRGPLGRCERLRLLGYRPGGGGGLQRGLLLRDPGAGPATRRALLALLDSCLEAPRPSLGEFGGEFGGAGLRLWQRPWELRGGREWRQAEPERVVAAPEPALHPAVPDLPRAAVFPHREAARAVLEACTPFLPAAGAVLELVDRCPRQLPRGPFPVIVVEGLDATGKTTVTRALADALGAALLRSPPAGLSPWRQAFDEEPDMVRRAFYSLGNYIAASEIAAASARAPVVVDRFWHSTAAYAIATEVSGAVQHLPPARHPIYQWPKDLLRPDLVVLLTVSPEERRERIRGRGLERTAEEEELEASSTFRQKVEACYERMEDPGCHAVDASPSREQVLQAVLGLVRDRCPQLP